MHEIDVSLREPQAAARWARPRDRRRYEGALADAALAMRGHTWWHVNSASDGGGVAELLHALLGYVAGAGIATRWLVIDGEPAFFEITKRIHNRLHGAPGDGGPLGPDERTGYDATLARELEALGDLVGPGDVVVLHDPQTVGLTRGLLARGAHLIWVCHVGVDAPNELARDAWRFLLDDARSADACVFTRSAYVWDGLDPARVEIVPPCIDPASPKNLPIDHTTVEAVLEAAEVIEAPGGDPTVPLADGTSIRVTRSAQSIEEAPVPAIAPLVVQVSRWDRLKDPVGVLRGFASGVPSDLDAHLVLAGPQVNGVSDDPEGADVLAEVRAAWEVLPAASRSRAHLVTLPVDDLVENAVIVNALQRRADVVVQKSVAEGFGLTVTEAMWKERPVVAGRVGGIKDQIEDGRSGLLVDPTDLRGFGDALTTLLCDDALAMEIGHVAQRRVRARFLPPHFLAAHLELARRVVGSADP